LSETRLLVVEDEANIVEALSYVLQRAGFLVETVSDGDAALQLLKRERFAAVVLDIMIPGMNGFDILRAVRADPRLADLPILVLTARGQAKDRQMAEEIGASAFITKPFSNAEVVERLRSFTGKSQQGEEG
jgi:DNA-binding response OmpR family regulator